MRRWALFLSVVGLQGCSNLTEGAGGVVGLEIQTPSLKTIEVGETLQLTAVALDKDGNPVATTIDWRAYGSARYQLRAAVSAPGSAIRSAYLSAASAGRPERRNTRRRYRARAASSTHSGTAGTRNAPTYQLRTA